MPDTKKLYPINYLGKVYNTTIHKDLSDIEYVEIVKGLSLKPDYSEVLSEMRALANGGSRIGKSYSYFVRDIARKTRLCYNNWSIDEAIRHKPLMEFFAGKVAANKKVYPDSMPLWKKIETAFRLCGFRTCSKPSNFPIAAIDGLLREFCGTGPNYRSNYMDFSCGWGVRLLSSLRNGINYFGVDPNDELVPTRRNSERTMKR